MVRGLLMFGGVEVLYPSDLVTNLLTWPVRSMSAESCCISVLLYYGMGYPKP